MYAAAHLSLAVLELLVHVRPERVPDGLVAVEIDVPRGALRVRRAIVHDDHAPLAAAGPRHRVDGDGWPRRPFKHGAGCLLGAPGPPIPYRGGGPPSRPDAADSASVRHKNAHRCAHPASIIQTIANQ
ncbi:MAG: hypothetical protein ACOY71_12065 [Gemmatimonadota bacterium]